MTALFCFVTFVHGERLKKKKRKKSSIRHSYTINGLATKCSIISGRIRRHRYPDRINFDPRILMMLFQLMDRSCWSHGRLSDKIRNSDDLFAIPTRPHLLLPIRHLPCRRLIFNFVRHFPRDDSTSTGNSIEFHFHAVREITFSRLQRVNRVSRHEPSHFTLHGWLRLRRSQGPLTFLFGI